jgi:transcriptional antiterminator NusG
MVEEKEISVKEIKQENQQEEEKAKWWIIRVKSGKEDLVKSEIEKLAQQESKIKEVFTPEEEQKVKRKGKKGEEKEVLIKKKLISGYVYVKMELDEQLWNKIRKIPNVIALLGERGFPLPISSEKIESLQDKTAAGEIRRIFSLSIGDRVRIKSGPLKGFAGIVEWLNEDKSKARILISIFGRQTPVEIETSQVEKET